MNVKLVILIRRETITFLWIDFSKQRQKSYESLTTPEWCNTTMIISTIFLFCLYKQVYRRRYESAVHRSPNCETPVSAPLSKFCEKIASSQKFHLLSYGQKRFFFIWRRSAFLNFRNLEFMSRDLYRHAILFLCAKFHWSWTTGCWVMTEKRCFAAIWRIKLYIKWRSFAILNFHIFLYLVIWLSSSSKCAIDYLISSKSDDFLLRYGYIASCNMASVRHLEFAKFFESLYHVTSIAMLFCFCKM